MSLIKKIVLGASSRKSLYFWGFFHGHIKDIKVLIIAGVLSFVGLFQVLQNQKIEKNHLLDIVSLYKIKIIDSSPILSADLINIPKKVLSKIQFNVEDLISTTMSYSYSETQLGFYLKDFKFFDSNSKATVEQSILSTLPPVLSRRASKYLRAVLNLSEYHQVDPLWVLSIMWTESHFNHQATSHAGAKGLMQIMPATKKYVYRKYTRNGNKLVVEGENFDINAFFPYEVSSKEYKNHVTKLVNIELGIIYLKTLLDYFDNHTYATVAYNMGPGWTRYRLKNNKPVGTKNEYLFKVQNAYKQIVKKI